MVKVWCSEMLDYVVDETVQIFGGAGYVEDYPAERYWRDARVNRIFEGTNEINRLLVPGRLLRRAMKGELPVFQKAHGADGGAHRRPVAARGDGGLPGRRGAHGRRAPRRSRSCAWAWRCRSSAQELERAAGGPRPLRRRGHGDLRARERRAPHAEARGGAGRGRRPRCRRPPCAASPRTRSTASRSSARRLLAAVDEGDMLRTYLAALKRFTKRETLEHGRPAPRGGGGGDREGRVPVLAWSGDRNGRG